MARSLWVEAAGEDTIWPVSCYQARCSSRSVSDGLSMLEARSLPLHPTCKVPPNMLLSARRQQPCMKTQPHADERIVMQQQQSTPGGLARTWLARFPLKCRSSTAFSTNHAKSGRTSGSISGYSQSLSGKSLGLCIQPCISGRLLQEGSAPCWIALEMIDSLSARR